MLPCNGTLSVTYREGSEPQGCSWLQGLTDVCALACSISWLSFLPAGFISQWRTRQPAVPSVHPICLAAPVWSVPQGRVHGGGTGVLEEAVGSRLPDVSPTLPG